MRITKQSQLTGIFHTMDIPVTPEQLNRWQRAEADNPDRLIQNAMPHLTLSEREFLMTGITDEEWAVTEPPEDERYYTQDDIDDWLGKDQPA